MGLLILIITSVVMALSCFLAGALPLSMTLSSSQLRLISTIGMGVLVGTSLIVIIPEGIEAVYAVELARNSQAHTHLDTRSNGIQLQWPSSGLSAVIQRSEKRNMRRQIVEERALNGGILIRGSPKGLQVRQTITRKDEPSTPPSAPTEPAKDSAPTHNDAEDSHENEPPTFFVGLSLVLGFVLMYLIEKVPRHASENLQPPAQPRHISLDNLSQGLLGSAPSQEDDESESFLQSLTPTPKQSRSLATTTGLVIHAFADGIAMGASASTSDTSLGFIIFLAILVHKAPAAFGLTSVLLKQGLSKRAARGHLIIFSLASPVGAISTWVLVSVLGGKHMEGEKGQWWTGMLLLFSAGTFLWVAMHAMQEDSGHDHPTSNGFSDNSTSQRKQPKPQVRDTVAAVGGMLLPLLTQFGHHH